MNREPSYLKGRKFVMIPLEVSQHPAIGPYEVAVYVALAQRANNESGTCWPSQATIMADSKCGLSRVKKSIAKLENAGLIAVQRRRAGNVYRLMPSVAPQPPMVVTQPSMVATQPQIAAEQPLTRLREPDSSNYTQRTTESDSREAEEELKKMMVKEWNALVRDRLDETTLPERAKRFLRNQTSVPSFVDRSDRLSVLEDWISDSLIFVKHHSSWEFYELEHVLYLPDFVEEVVS